MNNILFGIGVGLIAFSSAGLAVVEFAPAVYHASLLGNHLDHLARAVDKDAASVLEPLDH